MKNSPPTIPCRSCSGTGHAPMPQQYQDVLDAYGKRKLCTISEIRSTLIESGKLVTDKPSGEETIVHKRVAKMVGWGKLKRVRQITPEKNGKKVHLHRAWVFERV